MLAVRFHGRGGQGTVIASKLLASAMFQEGWQVQAFPSFGAERSGAPVAAFLRADRQPITIHYQVYEPDHVVVLDAVLLGTIDVTAGLKPGGTILVNTTKRPEDLKLDGPFTVATCDATGIALRHGLGSRTTPIVNTAIVGAWAALTGAVSLEAIVAQVPSLVPVKADANISAATDAANDVHVAPAWNPEPQNPEPGNPGTRNPEPENPEPRNPEPENPEPRNPEPGTPEPGNPGIPEPGNRGIHAHPAR